MKRLFLLTSLFVCLFKIAHSQAGGLDTSFGNNGIVTTKSNKAAIIFASSAVQKDGKIVTTGFVIDGINYTFLIARYNTNGNLDSSFSSDGIITTGITFPYNPFIYPHNIENNSKATAAAIQADGKIVVTDDSLIMRYNTNGSPDNTFSTSGKQKAGFEISVMNVQSDGKIVAAGGTSIARYNTNGSLDNSFNGTGVLTTFFYVNAFAFQSDGKIVAGGDYDGESMLIRFNTDGSEDATFYVQGIPWVSYEEASDSKITAVSIQADGKIIIAGYGGTSERYDMFYNTLMARFNTDGSLDKTFSNDGVTQIFMNANSALVSLQSDGKIVVSSNLYDNIGCGYDCVNQVPIGFGIARLNSDGNPDTTFGPNKIFDAIYIQSLSVANNKLYTTGYGTEGGKYGFIARYLLNANNTPPTVSLTTPTNNATYLAPAAHLKLSAVATDRDGTISKLEFYNGNTLLHTETVIPYGYVWTNVPVGNYTLTAKAYNNSGLVTTSAPVHISVVPNKAPTVSIIKPDNNQSYAAPAYIHFEASASDSDGRITRVEFYNGSKLLNTQYQYPYTFVWKNVPGGTYTITAVATDNWGAHTTSLPVRVRVVWPIVSNKPSSINGKTDAVDAVSVRLAPNPATDVVNIYTSGLQQDKPATISVISSSGIVMKTMQTGNSTQAQIDVSSLAKGVYTIKITSGNKTFYREFMKM